MNTTEQAVNEATKGTTTERTRRTTRALVPSMRYRDALRMISWLEEAFGFERQAVYMGENGSVAHAQLLFGGGMLMLGSVDNGSEHSALMRQPDEIGGAETQTVYLMVEDCEAVYGAPCRGQAGTSFGSCGRSCTAGRGLPAAIRRDTSGRWAATIPGLEAVWAGGYGAPFGTLPARYDAALPHRLFCAIMGVF